MNLNNTSPQPANIIRPTAENVLKVFPSNNTMNLRDAMCEVKGEIMFIQFTEYSIRCRESVIPTRDLVNCGIQTDDILHHNHQCNSSSTSILSRLTSKFKSNTNQALQVEEHENCYKFIEEIPNKKYAYAEPEVVSWIKPKSLPDASLLIAVAMYEKLEGCLLKGYLKKNGINICDHYQKTINAVTKLYKVANKFVVVINKQNKTKCSDLVHLLRTVTTLLHLRNSQTFQLAIDVSCDVERLENAINFITNSKLYNVKFTMIVPFNGTVKFERALSSRWIIDTPLPNDVNSLVVSKRTTEAVPSPPTYCSEEVTDHYYHNSIQEILHYMKFSNMFTCVHLAKLRTQNIGTLPFSASTLSSVKVYVYDNHNQRYIEEPVSEHQWGFDGETLVKFDSEKKRFITTKRYIFCSTATEIMLDQQIFERINELPLPKEKTKPEIISIQGVPGCGKSTWILNTHALGKDLVLSSTKYGINDIKRKVESRCKDVVLNYDSIKTNYRTIASYLLNGTKKYNTVYIDEYMMVHAGLLGLVAWLSDCREMFILGDQNQIPYIDRLNYVNMRFFDANMYTTKSKHLNTTYRCPVDVVYALKKIYPEICTTNTAVKTVYFKKSRSIADIPIMPNTLYLTFTKSDKSHLINKFKLPESSKIMTIHEAQGLTSINVICVRLTDQKIKLFESLPHAIVAVTRHTHTFHYFSPVEGDQLHTLLQRAINADQQKPHGFTYKSQYNVNKDNSESILKAQSHSSRVAITGTQRKMNLTFYYQNVNKMSSKASTFHNFVLKTLFPAYIICETSFNKDILSSEFFPTQYVVYRCDRTPQTSIKRSGGGVLIAVDTSIPSEAVELKSVSIEQLCVKVMINKKTIYIYVVYIPPDASISSYTTCCDSIMDIKNMANQSDIILITGDFNFPSINWTYDVEMDEILPLNVSSDEEHLFTDTIYDSNLSQICQLRNGLDRTLDLIFTNEPGVFKINESSTPFVINDIHHKSIEILLESDDTNKSNSHQSQRPYYNFRKADTTNLVHYLERVNWIKELNSSKVDENVEIFYKIILQGIELYVPTTVAKLDKYPPWYDDKLINLKNKKDKAYKDKLKEHSEASKQKFTECNQNFENYFEKKYKNYLTCIKDKIRNDPKHFWSFFKTKREINGFPVYMTFNGEKSCDPEVISNMFAEFFQSVFKPEDVDKYENPHNGEEGNLSIKIPHITPEDIHKALETFGDGCGPDQIPASFLKDYTSLDLPLCMLFNQSLRLGEFPQKWKTTKITPFFKTGARSDVSCYRGITSISSIPKLFELVICNSFREVVPRHISPYQHGFMPRRSTSTNLIDFTSSTIKVIESHKQVDVVYTDFAKAFDSISHCKALERLHTFGFSDQFVAWFKSYLSGRIQYIEIGSKRSKLIQATSGVPQGSHVGPWIFTIFINAITEVIQHSNILMFADDLKIYRTVEHITDSDKLQEDIDNLANWCESNLLYLNVNKCKTISFHRKVNPVIKQYEINKIPLQKVSEIKDLGVTFVENMCSNKHIDQCLARANSMLGFIKRWTGDIYDLETIKILYYAYVRSQLEYAVNVWCPFYNGYICKLENIQKKFVRLITWKDGWEYDHELPYHQNLQQLPPYPIGCKTYNIATLENRRELLKCSFVGNILLGHIDAPPLLEKIKLNVPSRNLRSQEFLHIDIHRTNYGANEPVNMMCKSFNQIDHLFDFTISKDSFKRRLKQYFASS